MLYTTAVTPTVFGLRREIERLFESTFGRNQVGRSEWIPAVDIRETDLELTFEIELPGIKLENVEVSAANGVLTIQGQRTELRAEGDDARYYLVERPFGSFVRRFQLPLGVDAEKIEADVEQGVLQVHIPKGAMPQPKMIQIKAGDELGRRVEQALTRGDRQNSVKPSRPAVAALTTP